jgi:hypothetical protein
LQFRAIHILAGVRTFVHRRGKVVQGFKSFKAGDGGKEGSERATRAVTALSLIPTRSKSRRVERVHVLLQRLPANTACGAWRIVL